MNCAELICLDFFFTIFQPNFYAQFWSSLFHPFSQALNITLRAAQCSSERDIDLELQNSPWIIHCCLSGVLRWYWECTSYFVSFVCSKQLISNVNSIKECSVNYAHKCKRYKETRTLRKILESYGCKKKYMKKISSTHMNRGVIGEPFSSFQQYSWHTFIKIFVLCIAIAHALTHEDQNSQTHTQTYVIYINQYEQWTHMVGSYVSVLHVSSCPFSWWRNEYTQTAEVKRKQNDFVVKITSVAMHSMKVLLFVKQNRIELSRCTLAFSSLKIVHVRVSVRSSKACIFQPVDEFITFIFGIP